MAMSIADNGRQHLDRALMLINAIRHDPPPSIPESLPEEEETFYQRLMRNVVPFIMFFVKLFASVAGLIMLSIITYWFIYSVVIMRGLEVQSHPIFFDYSAGGPSTPFARVDLQSSSNTPWMYACNSNSESNFCVEENERQDLSQSENDLEASESPVNIYHHQTPSGSEQSEKVPTRRVLKSGQRYFVDVVLFLPESEVNKKLGIFMLTVDLRSYDGTLLARSKQSSLFPYESGLVGITRKLITIIPLLSGVVDETKAISLLCFDNYMDSEKTLSYAELSLQLPHSAYYPTTTQTIQILSAEFHYGKMMSPLQRFFRSWFYFCAFIGIFVLFVFYSIIALHVASRQGWLMNRHTYYPGLNDIFGSENGSTSDFDSRSHHNSWAGPEVEILDEDGDGVDEDDAWEPLDTAGTENTNKSNIIPDDESTSSQNKDRQAESHTETGARAFPLGALSQNPTVQSHPSMFSSPQNNNFTQNDNQADRSKSSTAQEEEKCLADMVMKGLSKWEVFTDHDDPDETIPSDDQEAPKADNI